jgi:hypothetical protein
VGEEMMDRHLLGDVAVRVVGQVLSDLVVERQPALLGELGDGDPREHLVHGSQVELRVDLVRKAALPVGQAIGLGEERLGAPGQKDDAGELALGGEVVQVGTELGGEPGLGRCLFGGLSDAAQEGQGKKGGEGNRGRFHALEKRSRTPKVPVRPARVRRTSPKVAARQALTF